MTDAVIALHPILPNMRRMTLIACKHAEKAHDGAICAEYSGYLDDKG